MKAILLTKRERADRLLDVLFAKRSRIEINEIVEAGQKQDISRSTLARAARARGIHMIHNGPQPGFWEKP